MQFLVFFLMTIQRLDVQKSKKRAITSSVVWHRRIGVLDKQTSEAKSVSYSFRVLFANFSSTF